MDHKTAKAAKKSEAEAVVKKTAGGMSADKILEKLKRTQEKRNAV